MAAALAAGALAAVPALAQVQTDERALYLGGGIGVNDDEESVWRLFGGYRAHRNLAVELGYADLGEMNIAGRPANTEAWELVGLGILPLTEQISVYGKLGGYRGEAKGGGITETRNDLTFGFGGGAFGGVSDQDVISLNAIYRFR
jgi:OOP family OmpA-OmpF porin